MMVIMKTIGLQRAQQTVMRLFRMHLLWPSATAVLIRLRYSLWWGSRHRHSSGAQFDLVNGSKIDRSLCNQQNIAGVVQWQNGSFPT
jgi:hypothetical protein